MRQDSLLGLVAGMTLAMVGAPAVLAAQESPTLPPDSLSLLDGSGFAGTPGGWRIVGDVSADRTREHHIRTEPGTGILANLAGEGDGADLRTNWEHGDIDLELEFMMPRGSNSGIYFQGRYELQLLDSWGVETPTYSDVGGIYERWDESRGRGREGYEGHAPRLNAARAPGLWQTLRVEFRAPRFDAQGRKIANARFARVELNGAVLHENIELNGPTRGASLPGEAATGPLVIQGDHGPIAFRKIRFKRYGPRGLELDGLRFRAYEGSFQHLPDLSARTPDRSGETSSLTATSAGVADAFALVHEGTIDVPTAGRYLLELRLNWIDAGGGDGNQGGGRLLIGGREVLSHSGRARSVTTEAELPAGRQAFVLELYKNREGRPASFTLFAEGPGVARQALHGEASLPRGSATGPIRVEPADEPYLLRGFVEHGGEKRTHVISVGEPSESHYSYDAELGSILLGWRGPFLETTQMWEGRGEPQLAVPRGSVLELPGGPTVAILPATGASWPDSMPAASAYQFLGYDLDAERRPTFRYRLAEATIEDRIRPVPGRRGLAREIRATAARDLGGFHVRLAEGESIERQRDGAYLVDGRYYLVPSGDARGLVVRAAGQRQELLAPLIFRGGDAAIVYEIIW